MDTWMCSSWEQGNLQYNEPIICRIITSIINPGRAGASIINPGSAALARLRKWRSSDMRRFPANEGDRRRGRCRVTGRTGRAERPGPARGSFPASLPGALCRGFFPRLCARPLPRTWRWPRALRGGSETPPPWRGEAPPRAGCRWAEAAGTGQGRAGAGQGQGQWQWQGKADVGKRGLRAGFCHWQYVNIAVTDSTPTKIRVTFEMKAASRLPPVKTPGAAPRAESGSSPAAPSPTAGLKEQTKARDEPLLYGVCGLASGIWR